MRHLFFLSRGRGGAGTGSITRIAKMMNLVSSFAQCVRPEPTKSRTLFPLSYMTNKNPRAFASVCKIKK